jgi:hypothetical protein
MLPMQQRPGRPLGLSLAIITSAMLFSILPIGQIIFFLALRQRFQNIEFLEGGGAIGGNMQFSDTALIWQVIGGVIFLIIAIFAWRGKPPSIRYLLLAAVLILTAVTIVVTIISLSSVPDVQLGIDSAASIQDSLLRARLVVTALVSLYVVWYVNRGPARAFYRGYYLAEPQSQNS